MRLNRRNLALSLLVATTPVSAFAEPAPATTWLMNEPMSIWDWGIFRLQGRVDNMKEVQSLLRDAKWFFGDVEYDWDANRIKIQIALDSSALTSKSCIENMRQAKAVLTNYTFEASKQREAAIAMIAGTFSHAGGYQSKNEPKKLAEEIARLVQIEVQLHTKDSQGVYHRKVQCRSDLLEADISVVQQ
jgi:hypothetical protein